MSFTPRSFTEFPAEGYDVPVATIEVKIHSDAMKHDIKVSIPLFKFNGDGSLAPNMRQGSLVVFKGRVQVSFLADVEVEICVDGVCFGQSGRAWWFDVRGYQETTGYGSTYSEAIVGGVEDEDLENEDEGPYYEELGSDGNIEEGMGAKLQDQEETGAALQDQKESGSGLGGEEGSGPGLRDEEKPEFGFEEWRLPQEGFSLEILHLLQLHLEE